MAKRKMKRPRVSARRAIAAAQTVKAFLKDEETVTEKDAKAASKVMRQYVTQLRQQKVKTKA